MAIVMETMGERLRAARSKAGYGSAKAAAEAMGVAVSTYIQHESGTRGYGRRVARYAKFFKVAPEWLAFGSEDRLSEQVLSRMLETTLRQIPAGATIGDWPRLAAPSLYSQLVRFRAEHGKRPVQPGHHASRPRRGVRHILSAIPLIANPGKLLNYRPKCKRLILIRSIRNDLS
jgi:transcriptional regulator with XRE-family HTH domain